MLGHGGRREERIRRTGRWRRVIGEFDAHCAGRGRQAHNARIDPIITWVYNQTRVLIILFVFVVMFLYI